MAPQTIAGRYQVERPIGRGGMGTVWLCRDQRLGRHVAVKQVGTIPGETAPDLARALREARLSAALNHPNVVSVYDVVEEDDQIWLVMEHVASRTLAQVIAEDGPLSPESAVGIGAQIAEALAATHAAGTIHRDVKPGNILVTADHVAKISDFGIARARDHGHLTRTGLVTGTPAYFSPELARGEEPTTAADVWALGATLYAAVEGHPPYEDQPNALAVLARIASSPPPPARNADFLTEPIGRMLDPDPGSRWSMVEASHALSELQQRHARQLIRETPSEPAAPPAIAPDVPAAASGVSSAPRESHGRPGPGALLVAALSGLLALAAVGGLLLRDDSGDRSTALTPGSSPSSSQTVQHHAKGRQSPSPSVTSTPSSSASSSPPPVTGSPTTVPSTQRAVTGTDAEQFVRRYYATLPSNTRTAWSALSPDFQDRIGGYADYQGFWSTISRVSVDGTRSAGRSAVDVSLTYTTDDGRVDSEVRRIFLDRQDTAYLIAGDAIVG